ncbi:MAG: malate:quinone oxidoreductase [Candidatus Thiodiazotropha endolucinida]
MLKTDVLLIGGSIMSKTLTMLVTHPLFEKMAYANNPATLEEWLHLIMAERDMTQPKAATRVVHSKDINLI